MIFEIIFWLSFSIMIYVYFGFPTVIFFVSLFRKKPVQKRDIQPSVSIIISAFNEEKHIMKTIENCLEFDYPRHLMEIIVVSDGSTDNTNSILKQINNPLIKTRFMAERVGKTECQNFAASIAENEVLFFTDATTMTTPNAIKILVRNLHDPAVGCVTGRPVFKSDEGLTSKGLGKREEYEIALRSKLSEINTLFGADPMYVIPRRLYIPLKKHLPGGFAECLKLLEKGYRTVYELEALAFVDRPAPKIEDEFHRRSRIVFRGMQTLIHMRHLMNPFKYGLQSVALISTRFLRWLSPVFLLGLFISSLFLLNSYFYLSAFVLQVLFYCVAFMAFLMERKGYRLGLIFYLPLYFCTLALAATYGLLKLLGEEAETGFWETRNR